MRRMTALLLAGLAALTLTGCRRGPGLLPYAREIEDMELMQTLGVDRAGEGQVEVTASSGSGDPAEGAATAPPTSTSAMWASSCWGRGWPGRGWSPPWTIFSGM